MLAVFRSLTIIVVGALCVTGCAIVADPPNQIATTVAPLVEGAAVTKAFLETISATGIRRWETSPVTIAWAGTPTLADRRVLDEMVAWVNTIPEAPHLVVTSDGTTDALINIHAVARSKWPSLLGKQGGQFDTVDAVGVTTAEWSERGVMQHATVVIDAYTEQVQRNRTISHEVMHALGIGHHTCAGGIVYGAADYDPTWKPGVFDGSIIALNYDTRLATGASESVAQGAIQIGGTEIGCPAVNFSSVRSTTNTWLWCQATGEVRACQESGDTPNGGPLEGATPIAWVKNGTIFDYDPRLYVTFAYDNQRVLCEIPPEGKRAPCQVTQTGNSVLQADWWTDGHFLHKTPEG